jgi:hypothetical protein
MVPFISRCSSRRVYIHSKTTIDDNHVGRMMLYDRGSTDLNLGGQNMVQPDMEVTCDIVPILWWKYGTGMFLSPKAEDTLELLVFAIDIVPFVDDNLMNRQV